MAQLSNRVNTEWSTGPVVVKAEKTFSVVFVTSEAPPCRPTPICRSRHRALYLCCA